MPGASSNLDAVLVILRWAWVFSECALIFLLYSRKLYTRYPWFSGLITVGLLQQITLLPFDHHGWPYVKIWAIFELVRLAVLCGATLELTKRLLERYAQLSQIAVAGFGLIFAVGICMGAEVMAVFFPARTDLPIHAHIAMRALRLVSFSTAAYLLGVAVWFSLFPIPMRRNASLHQWLLALYGGVFPGWATLMTDACEDPFSRNLINVTMMAGCTLCLWTWSVGFTTTGEKWGIEEGHEQGTMRKGGAQRPGSTDMADAKFSIPMLRLIAHRNRLYSNYGRPLAKRIQTALRSSSTIPSSTSM
jgi:hypothetical protein